MKFGFVAKHRGIWPVNLMCEALGVSLKSPFMMSLSQSLSSVRKKSSLATDSTRRHRAVRLFQLNTAAKLKNMWKSACKKAPKIGRAHV